MTKIAHLPQIKSHLSRYPVFYLLLLSAIIRVGYVLLNYPLWWDSHVYIGIGKYIFSQGKLGIWESFRPLIHPFILGLFWKLGINPFIIGKILDIILSTIAIYLLYLVAKNIFDEKIALLSAAIFSLTPLFIIFSGLILTEPLAIVLGLLALLILLQTPHTFKLHQHPWHLLCAGFLLALSFLTKFPQGIWFGTIFLILTTKPEPLIQKIKTLLPLTLGFLLPLIPYLLLNYHLYHNPLEPFIQGSKIVETATWLYGSGISYYFIRLFLALPIYLFFWYYLYLFHTEQQWKTWQKNVLLCIPLLTLIYFLYVPRKETRYLVTVLPLFAIMSAYAITKIYNNLKKQTKPLITPHALITLCLIMILLPLPITLHFQHPPTFEKEINDIITQNQINGTILTSDPAFVSFLNQRIITLDGIEYAAKIYSQEKTHYQLLFINNCDLSCPPNDNLCAKKKQSLLIQITQENTLQYQQIFKDCTYSIYIPNK